MRRPRTGDIRAALACVALVIATGCGGGQSSPTGPTPPPTPSPAPTVANVAGTWSGRITVRLEGAPGYYQITATLQQSGDQVTGTFEEPGYVRGEIAGTLSGFGVATRFSGTTTWETETATATGRCFGRTDVNGPASPPAMTWTSADVSLAGCTGPLTDVVWTLTRVAAARQR